MSTEINSSDMIDIEVIDERVPVRYLDSYPVLVIDDDKWMLKIFNQYLSSWGFNYLGAFDAFDGLSQAIKHKPLMIFLDIVLPEVNGDIALKFIRNIQETSHIPVIIISSNLNKDILKSTFAYGAKGFILKPFTQETLLLKIQEILDPEIYNGMVEKGMILPNQVKKKAVYIPPNL